MDNRELIREAVAEKRDLVAEVNRKIWEYAELGHKEFKSARLLCDVLKDEGFVVTEQLCGLPTAFKAVYGSGHPVLGLLGEYDALPILSQEAGCPEQRPICDGAPGHGCGHSALGAASLAAALAVKKYLEQTGRPGTVIYFGCSAEETCGAKPFMARDGEFDGVDGVFAWHPGTDNGVDWADSIACTEIEYEFFGTTAHAGGSPHLGRSALDACELMNVGCNYLREHMVSEARIHYAYLDCGGTAPNVVQDHTRIEYMIRAPRTSQVQQLIARVNDVAKGAALMTGTTVKSHLRNGYSDTHHNHVMSYILEEALLEFGAPDWDEQDMALARQFVSQYNPNQREAFIEEVRQLYPADQVADKLENPLDTRITCFQPEIPKKPHGGSTDVGDVAYVTPTTELSVATASLGCPGHSWFMTAQTNSRIGEKGMLRAGEVMALACVKAMEHPEKLVEARQEMLEYTGGEYHCPMEGVEMDVYLN